MTKPKHQSGSTRTVRSAEPKTLIQKASGPKPTDKPALGAQAMTDPGPVATPAPVTKIDTMVDLMSRPDGASIAALSEATGWLVHSVRGAISGNLKKQRGLTVVSEKIDGVRIYRIAASSAAMSEIGQ